MSHHFCLFHVSLSAPSVESLYTALKNIDRSDIVTSIEGPAPPPVPRSLEEGACRLSERDSTMLSPSVLNGETFKHTHTHLLHPHSHTRLLLCVLYYVEELL